MLSTCCRCALACSVAASLTAVPAHAQDLGSSIVDRPAAITEYPAAPAVQQSPFPSRQKSFFGNLFNDFRAIPTRENLLIAGFGGLAAGMAYNADGFATRSLSGSARMGTVLSSGDTLGSAAAQMAGAIATQVIGRAAGSPKVSAIGGDLVRAQIVSQAVTQGIKLSVGRTRPDGTEFSFPSGHTASSFATASVLQRHLGWKAGVPAYALATYVAASRVQVQRHFLSDVTMGAAIGIIAGRAVTVGRGDARFALAPSAVPGGAGVNFTWLGGKQ
jgi:membrane-associated phospholipid phosphatase